MDSLKESLRQIRTSIVLIGVIVVISVTGFMIFEGMDLLNAIWMTVVTLTTIGYGDIVPHSVAGRIFTILLILFGIGTFAFGAQAVLNLLFSPAIRELRQENQTHRQVAHLENHFILCGTGQLLDETIDIMERDTESRQQWWENEIDRKVRLLLKRVLGTAESGRTLRERLATLLTLLFHLAVPLRNRAFNALVVVTNDHDLAAALREKSMRVLLGPPTDDHTLQEAGIERAHALMVMLDDDAESLLAVLTARQYNNDLLITAALLDESMRHRTIRAGTNYAVMPYEIAGHFLNMATLRPAVSDYFIHILFDQVDQTFTEQLPIRVKSPWLGVKLGALDLRRRFDAGIIALVQPDGDFKIAPPPNHVVQEGEILIVVCPMRHRRSLCIESWGTTPDQVWKTDWQRLPLSLRHPHQPLAEDAIPGAEEAQAAIDRLANHFVICADGRAGQEAIQNLDPARPFVILTNDESYSLSLRQLGFRVVCGNPIHEDVLRQAGVDRALALMVTLEDEAESTLTVITARSLNRRLNITAAAFNPLMENKLKRAGADRVAMPLQVAAQFIMLATVRPAIADFFQHVVFNRDRGIETTELYMLDDSPFIGRSIEESRLDEQYDAQVIGIRQADGHFLYAPPSDYRMRPQEVMIVVTPMRHSDELRAISRGSVSIKLTSIRPKKPTKAKSHN